MYVWGGAVQVFPHSIPGVSASRCGFASVAFSLLVAVPAVAWAAPAPLAFADVQKLAENPRCGRAEPGSEFARRIAAIAIHESGGDPFIIGVNADRAQGLPAAAVRSATPGEAAAKARVLLAQGRSIDLGLMQINSAQLANHGLTVEKVFDACRNVAAGADHYARDVRAVWNLAHRRYNTGTVERGAAYAADVERVLARVPAIQLAGDAPPAPPAADPEQVAAPVPRRPPLRLEDALHATPPVSDDGDNDGMGDALHHSTRKVEQ